MIWWTVKVIAVVVLLNFVLDAAGWDPESWTLPWLFKGVVLGVVARVVVGPSDGRR